MKQTLAITVFCLLSTLTYSLDTDGINPALDKKWFIYKSTLNKRHIDSMDRMRRIVWESNLKYIEKHNLDADLHKHSYYLGMNEFGDLTHEEFKTRMFPKIEPIMNVSNTIKYERNSNTPTDIPEHIDWQRKGFNTPVKSQGFCGSCAQMAAVGGFEAAFYKKTGKLVTFSVQQVVNCVNDDGCVGAYIGDVLTFIQKTGIQAASVIPYIGRNQECVFNSNFAVEKLLVWTEIDSSKFSNELHVKKMMEVIVNNAPLLAELNGGYKTFSTYKYGIYQDEHCSPTPLNHGVVIVGYGRNYWKIKNSWGPRWGRNGYAYILKGHNTCGIEHLAFPINA